MVEENGSASSPNDLEKKIIYQIEYWFGDYNLPRDKFLQEESKKDEGWIPMEVLLKFNRLKTLSTDSDLIVAALKKSANILVEIYEDGTKIRRSPAKPLPENRLEYFQQLKSRTLYVKGFELDTPIDVLMEFFGKYGKVENLLMRRDKSKERNFKGSVFVTFSTRELCKAILDAESFKFGEKELIRMFESDYYAKKSAERQDEKMKKREQKMSDQQQQRRKNAPKEMPPYKTGLVIKITDIPKSVTKREQIKDLLRPHCEVDWVDFNSGDTEAFLRVKGQENEADKVLTAIQESTDGKLMIDDQECKAELVTGEEEKNYWHKTFEAKSNALAGRKQAHRGGGRGGRGGRRGGGRGRGRGGRGGGRGGHKNREDDEEDSGEVSDDEGANATSDSDRIGTSTTSKRPYPGESEDVSSAKAAKTDEN